MILTWHGCYPRRNLESTEGALLVRTRKAAILPFLLLAAAVQTTTPVQGQEVILPEFLVTDSVGTEVGAFAGTSDRVSGGSNFVRVLRHDAGSGENYIFYLGPNRLQGLDDEDVFYQNADCTGTAYVAAPETFDELPGLRGSVFVVGKKAGASALVEDSLILRGSGVGADNTSNILSRYRTDVVNGPACFTGSSVFPPALSVVAFEVADLSALIRPFKVE